VIGDAKINSSQLYELDKVARTIGLQTLAIDFTAATSLESAFADAAHWGADALIVLSNPLNLANRVRIAELAAGSNLPAIYLYRAHVDAGGLVSYGPDLPDMFRRCGTYIARILGGAKPSDLPIERPTRFELVVNLKTARAMGITISEIMLARADEVIE
jgi:putative ABC transport system substrate-binding protein